MGSSRVSSFVFIRLLSLKVQLTSSNGRYDQKWHESDNMLVNTPPFPYFSLGSSKDNCIRRIFMFKSHLPSTL